MPGFRFQGLFLALFPVTALAASEVPQTPYFESFKNEKTFMREGPGDQYRVKWVYHRKGLPVEVLATFDAWRRVRDMDGEIGWVHTVLLSRERSAMVTGKEKVEARRHEDAESGVVAEVEPGAIGKLVECGVTACEVKFDAAEGWIDRARLWGIHDGNAF